MTAPEELSRRLRELPSVDEVAGQFAGRYPHEAVVREVRAALAALREDLRAGRSPAQTAWELAEARLRGLERSSLRGVINATGVILHTNLGRAPLGGAPPVAGYSNLEYDIASGKRGKRDAHIGGLLRNLLGSPAIAVNNGAAAVFLALHELAAGGEVLVSRGELIEIGDGFRIPDIMRASGAALREVGTTNRTRLEDYREAMGERTRLILRVHPSNFRIEGFTAKPELAELAALARESGIPLYEDLGSGCLVDLRPFGVKEPLVRESLDAGVDLVSFSGDKLLGGPQAGILAGREDLVTRLRRNPMFRALRLDKLILESLSATLRALLLERWDLIPALAMIRIPGETLRQRANALAARIPGAAVVEGRSLSGGGATPEQSLPSWLVALPGDAAAVERQLRLGDPPVISRIEDGHALLDPRTVFPAEEDALMARLQSIL